MDDERIEIVERRVAYDGFFRIERFRLRHRLHDGTWSGEVEREVFERGSAVAMLLYDPDRDAVVLVEQFRLPAHLAGFAAWQLEVPAGIVDPGETEEAVARREIAEETGLAPLGSVVLAHRFLTSPGGSTETVRLFCARVDSRGAGGIHGLADENEDIKVVVLAWDEALARLRAGAIDNGFTILALWWLMAHRDELRSRWLGGDGPPAGT